MLYFTYNTEGDRLLIKQFICWKVQINLINLDSVCIPHLIISIAFSTRAGAKISVHAMKAETPIEAKREFSYL